MHPNCTPLMEAQRASLQIAGGFLCWRGMDSPGKSRYTAFSVKLSLSKEAKAWCCLSSRFQAACETHLGKTGVNQRCQARARTQEYRRRHKPTESMNSTCVADKHCFESWICTLTCQDHDFCFGRLPGTALQLAFGHRGWFAQAEAGTPTASW